MSGVFKGINENLLTLHPPLAPRWVQRRVYNEVQFTNPILYEFHQEIPSYNRAGFLL